MSPGSIVTVYVPLPCTRHHSSISDPLAAPYLHPPPPPPHSSTWQPTRPPAARAASPSARRRHGEGREGRRPSGESLIAAGADAEAPARPRQTSLSGASVGRVRVACVSERQPFSALSLSSVAGLRPATGSMRPLSGLCRFRDSGRLLVSTRAAIAALLGEGGGRGIHSRGVWHLCVRTGRRPHSRWAGVRPSPPPHPTCRSIRCPMSMLTPAQYLRSV